MRADPRVGRRIRAARLEAGLSLAGAGGSVLSPSHLCLIEHGRRGLTADRLIHLAERLGKGVGFFLADGAHPGHAEALVGAAERFLASGEFTRAAAILGDVLPRVPEDRTDLQARCHVSLGLALLRMRQYEFAAGHVEQGKALAAAAGDLHLIARAHNAAGAFHLAQNEYQDAVAELGVAARALRSHPRPQPTLQSDVLRNMGRAFRWLGRYQEALVHYQQATRAAETAAEPVLLGTVAHSAAGVLVDMRAYREARAQLEIALAHFKNAERLDLVAAVENGLGILFLETGKVEQAIPHLRRAVNLWTRLADDRNLGRNLTELGRAHVLLGQHDKALLYVLDAIRLAMRVNDDVEAAAAETLRAEILLARRRLREAEAALQFAIPIFERRGHRKELVQALSLLGKVLRAQGQVVQATEILGRALALAGVSVSID